MVVGCFCFCLFFSIFIQILIEHSESKQGRLWSDAAFCGVRTGSALFAHVLGLYGLTVMIKNTLLYKFCKSDVYLIRILDSTNLELHLNEVCEDGRF